MTIQDPDGPDPDLSHVWLAFASAALSGLGSAPHAKNETDARRADRLDDLIDDSADIADEMLEEYRERFDPSFVAKDEEEEEEEEEEERPRRRRK